MDLLRLISSQPLFNLLILKSVNPFVYKYPHISSLISNYLRLIDSLSLKNFLGGHFPFFYSLCLLHSQFPFQNHLKTVTVSCYTKYSKVAKYEFMSSEFKYTLLHLRFQNTAKFHHCNYFQLQKQPGPSLNQQSLRYLIFYQPASQLRNLSILKGDKAKSFNIILKHKIERTSR